MNFPTKKPSTFGKIAPMAGTVIGGVAGAFAGNPMMGAAIGGAAGNAAAGIVDKDVGQSAEGLASGVQGAASGSESSAMARRLDTNNKLLTDAAKALPESGAAPDEQDAIKRRLAQAAFASQGGA